MGIDDHRDESCYSVKGGCAALDNIINNDRVQSADGGELWAVQEAL
jgi:hypothetical protein